MMVMLIDKTGILVIMHGTLVDVWLFGKEIYYVNMQKREKY
jgi:hypothetical protein